MRRWWLAIALLLSLGVNAGILSMVALARLRPARPIERALPAMGRGVERLADHLGLEGEDRRRFVARQQQFFADTREHRQRLIVARRQLREELTSPRPDRARVEVLLGEINRTTGELDRSLVDLVLDSREVLSRPQQREYFRFLARLRQGEPGAGARRPGPFQRRPLRPLRERPEPEEPEAEEREPGRP